MAKVSKKRQAVNAKVDSNKLYALREAVALVKDVNTTKFDASVDVHGTGKVKRVLVLCTPDKEAEAKAAGADYVGLDEFITKISQGWTDVDVIIAMPSVMAKVGQIGRILGPRGLMPNPKTGTVTLNVGAAVEEVKAGKISFRVDKYGIIHSPIGRVSFTPEKLAENAVELITTLEKMKPSTAKGTYMKSISIASTMSPGISVDTKTIR
jgi:large subunit ribosomal protein L1